MAIDAKTLQRDVLDRLDRARDFRLEQAEQHKNDPQWYKNEADYKEHVDFIKKDYREMRDGVPAIVRWLDKKGVLAEKDLNGTRVFDDSLYYDTEGFNRYNDSDQRNMVANIFADAISALGGKKESNIKESVKRLLGEADVRDTDKENAFIKEVADQFEGLASRIRKLAVVRDVNPKQAKMDWEILRSDIEFVVQKLNKGIGAIL